MTDAQRGIVRDALGIGIASGAYALSFGALATVAGLSLLQTVALSTLMFTGASQFARQGVRVNALCPGPVETQLLMRIFNADPGAYERRRVHLPMGRLARAIEIANAALFLASDESSYVNGTTFLVDGGLTAAYVTPE